jgi:hypothetical protein
VSNGTNSLMFQEPPLSEMACETSESFYPDDGAEMVSETLENSYHLTWLMV